MKKAHYGTTEDGREVDVYTLANDAGMRVAILTFGCVIASLEVPDRRGRIDNVVLGLDSLAGYALRSPHFGAIAGRYANRIARGRFAIDGKEYQLDTNAAPNAMHGGRKGFHKVVWQGAAGSGEQVILKYLSADSEESYPGNLAVEVRYSLGASNELRIDYEAATDKPTIVNLTNHSYFNLAGEGSGDVLDHLVTIESDHYTPVDATQVPTGEIRPVAGTPFDFTTPRPVGERIRSADEQMVIARGYDHNWVLRRPAAGGVTLAARAHEPVTGRILEVLTDAPGLQFYSANSLNGALVGPSGRAYRQSDGLCFEAQRFPDSPNHANFPPPSCGRASTSRSTTLFRFSTDAASPS